MSFLTWNDGPTWWMRFDAATIEEFGRTAEVSTYPVETGAILSDHYQPQPRQIALSGVVSNTPSGPNWTNLNIEFEEAAPQPVMSPDRVRVRYREERSYGRAGILRPLPAVGLPSRRLVRANIERAGNLIPQYVSVLKAQTAPDRITSFMLVVDQLMERRIPINVLLFGGVEWSDMMITGHRAPMVAGSSGGVQFALDLQQVIKADPAEVTKSTATRVDPAVKQKKQRGRDGVKAVKGEARTRALTLAKDVPNIPNPFSDFFPVP